MLSPSIGRPVAGLKTGGLMSAMSGMTSVLLENIEQKKLRIMVLSAHGGTSRRRLSCGLVLAGQHDGDDRLQVVTRPDHHL